MKILLCKYIYTPNGFKENLAVAFDEVIRDIESLDILKDKYPDAQIIDKGENFILYAGFINTHTHLEFSANKTTLNYGDFMKWLDSVIVNRDELVGECDNSLLISSCREMLRSGITSFGAISSFGNEMEVAQQTPQRVVLFNEVIGSVPAYADMLYNDFLERVKESQKCDKDSRVYPAIAIHSPYSVHPIILQKAIALAKKYSLPLSTHFMESKYEREWLDCGEGEFKEFFQKYFNTSTPVTNANEFINAFNGYPSHFVHCVYASQDELNHLKKHNHSIGHAPRSNRYLGCDRLKIEDIDMPMSVVTDGLSSNNSLNIFDELRASLFIHNNQDIDKLADRLIKSITSDGADILGLNTGRIEVGKMADFAIVKLDNIPQNSDKLALWTILHTKEVYSTYINGERYS